MLDYVCVTTSAILTTAFTKGTVVEMWVLFHEQRGADVENWDVLGVERGIIVHDLGLCQVME